MNYIHRSVPRSPQDVLAFSPDEVSNIVKKQLAVFIDSYMNTEGANREILKTIGATTLQYITDLGLDEDPTTRKIQLATLYEDITQQVPAVLLTDTSMNWESAGIGHRSSAWHDNEGNRYDDYPFIYIIPVVITIVTNSETATKRLNAIFSYMFGPLQEISGGVRIESEEPGSTWVITLPIIHTPGTVSKVPIEGSTKDHLWVAEFTPDIRFENITTIKSRGTTESKIVSGGPNVVAQEPVIHFDNTIIVGQTGNVRVSFMDPYDNLVIQQERLFVLWDPEKKDITAKSTGSFEIQLRSRTGETRVSKKVDVVAF